MDSSDGEQQIEDEDVLCRYGTALTPYEAGETAAKANLNDFILMNFHFVR